MQQMQLKYNTFSSDKETFSKNMYKRSQSEFTSSKLETLEQSVKYFHNKVS